MGSIRSTGSTGSVPVRGLVLVLVLVPAAAAGQAYVPQRVFDAAAGRWADFEVMAADLATADVVMVGEQHGDPHTHALERALLEALAMRRPDIAVSLEMFERDTQALVDAYLAGRIDEAAFLRDSRPWPRYPTDYRPLVELARERRWPVLAANVPRRLASGVAKAGLDTLASMPAADRPWLAPELQCPNDAYFDRFAKTMSAHPAGEGGVAAEAGMVARYYHAQCLKDETMGDSIAAAARGPGEGPLVVHYNGAFHSDFGHGAAERTRRRLPGSRVAIVSILPVPSLDGIDPPAEDRSRADYLIYTLATKRPQ